MLQYNKSGIVLFYRKESQTPRLPQAQTPGCFYIHKPPGTLASSGGTSPYCHPAPFPILPEHLRLPGGYTSCYCFSPHSGQNLAPGLSFVPQFGQNRRPVLFCTWFTFSFCFSSSCTACRYLAFTSSSNTG